MKRLFALTLALMMVLSMATVAFANGTNNAANEVGSITINGVGTTSVYEIYKLLDLESYNTTSGAYSYKVNAAWTGFFATADALAYVAIDDAGYVTWIAAEDDDTVAAFAKKALAYAEANDIDPVKSSTVEGDFVVTTNPETGKSTGVFSGLSLGYYLVDSDMGALCGLTTTNPDASVNAKNGIPTIDKQVEEDSTTQYGDSNTADIGQTVNFRTTINVHAGAQSYILHDKMSNGLTFDPDSVRAEHIIPGVTNTTTPVPAEYFTVETEDLGDDCTFHVVFTQDFCDHLETNNKVIVYYSAMLNRNAVIAGDGNGNETFLSFGENHTSNTDQTTTKTYQFEIVKTDSQNKLIDGAQFRVYDAAEGGTEIGVVPLKDSDEKPVLDANGNPIYRRARADEQAANKHVPIVVAGGKITVVGFDNGTYFLEETVAPAGYNKLTARQKFIISDGNLDATFNDGVFSTGSGVHVVNKTGSMLPETGAMGTLMFISFGMFVALGTGILLVTKKRMSMIED